MGLLLAGPAAQRSTAQSCGNPVACENLLQGSTGWDISGSGNSDIQGFATDISVNAGDTVNFKINTTASNYHLDIYRMGYYGGAGARKLTTITPSASLPQMQPACVTDAATKLIDCGNWVVSASWTVPITAVSGIYFADVIRPDNGHVSQIFWIVRNDSSHSDILFQTSDQTWTAYNDYGGHSLYGGAGTFDLNNRAFKVSYNRPFDTRNFEAATFLFNAEYPMVRWLEANGYDVSYFTGVDAVRNANLVSNHKVYVTVGHDEYVSKESRANIEAARDHGVNLAFFSGNEVFWKTRWENSIDGSSTPFRTMVCYKETYFGTGTLYQQDPLDPSTWTGTWADPRFSPPADGGLPQNALTGTLFAVNGPGPDNTNLSIQVPAADGKMRFWRNTSVASLGIGQSATLPPGTLGYEWDADVDNGFRPAGLIPLSTSTITLTDDLLLDYGATYGAGTTTHHLSLYRAPSGALVFGAGTVQWAWGLDNNHDGGGNTADVRMQQATLNLFADMGVQPATIQAGLIAATKSADTTAPTAKITAPAGGATVQYGTPITIMGTATDTGGGVVGAVEVSVNGGQTWHPATGRGQWSYSWSPWGSSGSAIILARAIDDSGNIQSAPSSVSFAISGQPTCPCSIWNNSVTPGTPTTTDSSAVELGVKFRSDVSGNVTGVRFYKGANNTGTHIGHLWTNQGMRLATVTFTNETASGWQQASFSSPVAISANTTYIASYYAPNGGYADDEPFFSGKGVDNGPLHALAEDVDGANGLFVYGTGGGFPVSTFNAANYWVDVVFTLSGTWSISGNAGSGGALLNLAGPINATATADASGNYTFSGLINGNYTVTPTKSGFTFSPASASVTINGANVTGVNFAATSLPTWSISGNAGTAGAAVTLSGAGTGTVAADGSGNYTFTGLVNGNYTVMPTKSGFTFSPVNQAVTVNGANLAGVNFTAASVPTWSISGTISPSSNGNGTTVTLSGAASATATADTSGNYTFTGLVNGTYTITPSKTGFGFSPASQNVTISSANASGVNFTATQSISIWSSSTVPGTTSENDTSAVELGLKFQSDVPGSVTGVRFYKGSANTGTHIGDLWTSTGTKLATVTFSGETASGWQQANFSSPISISANTTYVVSYYAPNGGYAADLNFFATAGVDNPPLHALSNGVAGGNGVYVYAAGGGFPSNTFSSTNYWVDVAFTPSSTFSISGAAGTASATVNLSGARTATVTADGSGNYTFTGLSNGNYTVTPTKSGFTFSPVNQAVTVSGANVTGINFTATANPTFSISGAAGTAGATVTLSGAGTGTVTADASGNYTFSGRANGNYTVTPTKSGFTFSPVNQAVTVNGANVTGVNFTANTAPTWSISGTLTGGAGATVTLSGAGTGTVTADASGNYTFTGLPNGNYTVTPSKSGFTFTPASTAVVVNGANMAGVNFTAKPALAIDATVFKDQGSASGTVAVSALSTTSANELLLAFIATDKLQSANTTVTGVTGAGLTWALVKRTNAQSGTAEIWRAFAATALSNSTVTATLSQNVGSSMTVVAFKNVDTSGTNGSGAIGATGGGSAASGTPTTTLVTTRNNSWVFGVGNDFDNAIARTPGSGQSLVHQYLTPAGDTYWVQRQNNTTPVGGTSVTINDTVPTTDRYNLSICEILQAP